MARVIAHASPELVALVRPFLDARGAAMPAEALRDAMRRKGYSITRDGIKAARIAIAFQDGAA